MNSPEDFVEKRRESYTKILCGLVRADTTNPPGNEYLAAKIIKKKLSKLKIKFHVFEKKKGRTNLVARVGNKEGKKILIATHLDVVPPGEGWSTAPFEPVIKKNLLYGRGASDDKSQTTAALLVLEHLKSIESKLRNEFIFVFAADEEKGGAYGLRYLLDENKISADYAIVVDVGGAMKKISIAEKGVLHLKISAVGRQAHGSTPQRGISAIAAMSKLIARLENYVIKHELHKFLTRPTINFGVIKGGSAANMVAASCELIIDIRYLPSQTPEEIINELRNIAERFGEFKFEIINQLPPTELDEKNILVNTISRVAESYGIEAKPKGLSGATDAKAFILKGIPAVGFDFADDFVAHNANEYCNLDNLFKFCSVLIDVCKELDSTTKK
jgi:acetylornithine deacetylase/succinyl-diaminopimelate desuccinylase family protein